MSVRAGLNGVNVSVYRLVAKGKATIAAQGRLCSNGPAVTSDADLGPNATHRAIGLRALPSIDDVLSRPQVQALSEKCGREIVTQVARTVVAQIRADLKDGTGTQKLSTFDGGTIEARILEEVKAQLASSLRRVINATGVVLHTNLGRAPLSTTAGAEIAKTATRYSNLEYDIPEGKRGKRDIHTARRLARLADAEAAVVVNNNAAAVFLVLHTLAKGAEVVVSRGELIEIGDGFRIPDIMSASGVLLREVGTTNRTSIQDYESAINERTRLLLRVHPSNFRITGFTERPLLKDLVALAKERQIPLYEDLGSGCAADLASTGLTEPPVGASCQAGVSVVSFSGDKLLGGPQAGIVAGQMGVITRIRQNPLFRALRVDKLTIAALEVTLSAYQRGNFDEIPALRMIRLTSEDIATRANRVIQEIVPVLPGGASLELHAGFSVIGGGSTPDQQLPTYLISVTSKRHSASTLERKLRLPERGLPVIARIENHCLVLDLRTVFTDEETALVAALTSVLH